MTGSILSRPGPIWLVLVALTIVAVSVAEGKIFGEASSVAVVLIGLAKARLIVMDYMEARNVPRPWGLLYQGWLVLVSLILLAPLAFG